MTGSLAAILLAFPFASLVGALFRFPIPLAGYVSGMEAVPLALMAVVFYGVLGGFFVLGSLGAMGGRAAHARYQPNDRRVRVATLLVSAGLALTFTVILSVLDMIIGPW